jgi:hypothetical protein
MPLKVSLAARLNGIKELQLEYKSFTRHQAAWKLCKEHGLSLTLAVNIVHSAMVDLSIKEPISLDQFYQIISYLFQKYGYGAVMLMQPKRDRSRR